MNNKFKLHSPNLCLIEFTCASAIMFRLEFTIFTLCIQEGASISIVSVMNREGARCCAVGTQSDENSVRSSQLSCSAEVRKQVVARRETFRN